MAWCPICKCEYKDGIEKCADCKVDLVDSLETSSENMTKDELEELTQNPQIVQSIAEDVAAVQLKTIKKSGVYQNSAQRSSENKSSAYILLTLGIIGVIVLALICMDIIPLYSGLTSKIVTSVVMGTLFVVFIVMGIVSMKNAKELDKLAVTESNLSKEIMSYCSNNLSAENIDAALCDEEWDALSDEIKYFKRIEYIKDEITKQFMNLDEEYVDFICDEIYTDLYEE